jgi:hypothetical protein
MPVRIGTIRWDGASSSPLGLQNASVLNPTAYQFRTPFYGTISSGVVSTYQNELLETRIKENAIASAAGINYWAPVWAASEQNLLQVGRGSQNGTGLNCGLNRYLGCSTAERFSLGFALILDSWCQIDSASFNANDWARVCNKLVEYFADPGYERVLSTRPLIYWYDPDSLISGMGSASTAAASITTLRSTSIAAGQGDPYIVLMTSTAAQVDSLGADALSGYSVGWNYPQVGTLPPYTDLVSAVQTYNNTLLASGEKVIPLAQTGLDNRPFNTTPMSWYPSGITPAGYSRGSSVEKANHIKAVRDAVLANPSVCETQHMLVNAWNESTEQADSLVPTIADGGEPLRTMASTLDIGDMTRWSTTYSMASTAQFYNSFNYWKSDGTLDLDNATFKATLHTSSYVPDFSAHTVFADVTNELSTGSGYTSGGVDITIASQGSWVQSTKSAILKFNDALWNASGGSLTCRRCVVRAVGTFQGRTDPLVACYDIDSVDVVVPDGYPLRLKWSSNAIQYSLP